MQDKKGVLSEGSPGRSSTNCEGSCFSLFDMDLQIMSYMWHFLKNDMLSQISCGDLAFSAEAACKIDAPLVRKDLVR